MPVPPVDDDDYVFVITSPRKAAELIRRLRFERAAAGKRALRAEAENARIKEKAEDLQRPEEW